MTLQTLWNKHRSGWTLNPLQLRFIACGVFLFAVCIAGCGQGFSLEQEKQQIKKINGVNLEAPRRETDESWTRPLINMNAGWVSLIPYGYFDFGDTGVNYNTSPNSRGFWGERPEGVRANALQARAAGLKVMLKPHLWSRGGWVGDFRFENEADWKTWEINYRKYILVQLEIARECDVDLFCIGTELRHSFNERPQFWRELICEIRAEYDGPLTIASNWDNFQNVSFWDALDYIGIDSYFPLSEEIEPATSTLIQRWKPIKNRLRVFSEQWNKPILFTEFGWLAVDQNTWNHWEKEGRNLNAHALNLNAQSNAFDAAFRTLWQEKWFAGGFIWEWNTNHERAGGLNDKDFTPQNKPAEQVIRQYYGQY